MKKKRHQCLLVATPIPGREGLLLSPRSHRGSRWFSPTRSWSGCSTSCLEAAPKSMPRSRRRTSPSGRCRLHLRASPRPSACRSAPSFPTPSPRPRQTSRAAPSRRSAAAPSTRTTSRTSWCSSTSTATLSPPRFLAGGEIAKAKDEEKKRTEATLLRGCCRLCLLWPRQRTAVRRAGITRSATCGESAVAVVWFVFLSFFLGRGQERKKKKLELIPSPPLLKHETKFQNKTLSKQGLLRRQKVRLRRVLPSGLEL